MSDVTELQGRITAALDRIRAGLDVQPTQEAPADAAASPELQAQLDEERTANAQLEERVKALKARQDGKISELEARVDMQRTQMAQLDGELQRLRAVNADLRQLTAQLRAAAADGVADPELINRATLAELDALSAQRDADSAEIEAILAELKPLIAESANAAG